MPTRFLNRRAAGRELAELLGGYASRPDTVVLGLRRGGVPVAYEIASALSLPLDVFVVRKLGLPHHEEVALGAIAPGAVRVLNRDLIEGLRPNADKIERIVVAVPVTSSNAARTLRGIADEVVSVITPEPFDGVGRWYVAFDQTSDEEVRRLLRYDMTRAVEPLDRGALWSTGEVPESFPTAL